MRLLPSFHKGKPKPKHELPEDLRVPLQAPRVVCDLDELYVRGAKPLPEIQRDRRLRDAEKLRKGNGHPVIVEIGPTKYGNR